MERGVLHQVARAAEVLVQPRSDQLALAEARQRVIQLLAAAASRAAPCRGPAALRSSTQGPLMSLSDDACRLVQRAIYHMLAGMRTTPIRGLSRSHLQTLTHHTVFGWPGWALHDYGRLSGSSAAQTGWRPRHACLGRGEERLPDVERGAREVLLAGRQEGAHVGRAHAPLARPPVQVLQRVERCAHVVLGALGQRQQRGTVRAQPLARADEAQPRADAVRLRRVRARRVNRAALPRTPVT